MSDGCNVTRLKVKHLLSIKKDTIFVIINQWVSGKQVGIKPKLNNGPDQFHTFAAGPLHTFNP